MKSASGLMVARMIKAMYSTNNEPHTAAAFAAAQNWADVSPIVAHIKGVVGGLTTAELLLSPVAQDFSAAVRPLTVLGRLQGMRRVPMGVRVITNLSGVRAEFIAQGKPIPVSSADITGLTLYPLKVAALAVVSSELFDASTPGAEGLLTIDLVDACAQATDDAFLDPTNLGSDEKPASVTSGVVPLTSSGSTFAQIDADLQKMVQQLVAAGSTLIATAWILRPQTAVYLAGLRDTADGLAYPAISVLGGMLKGLPVIVTNNLPGPGSPIANHIVLLDASQVALADEGAAEIAVSKQGTLQMSDTPTNSTTTGTATTMVSMWQTSSVSIRGVLWVNFILRRPFVSVLAGVTF
jgi:HK97 family phage major capsid protein